MTTQEQQIRHIKAWQLCGLRQAAYCRDHGLNSKTFGNWLRGSRDAQQIHPGPKTSKPHPQHKIYPYLLRKLDINRANQVQCSDVTYLPMASGFLYLTEIMDWYSRKVLSWQVTNSLDASFCVDALEEAIYRYGTPDIFNTDQGSQYTSEAFTKALKDNGIDISMEGKAAWRDIMNRLLKPYVTKKILPVLQRKSETSVFTDNTRSGLL